MTTLNAFLTGILTGAGVVCFLWLLYTEYLSDWYLVRVYRGLWSLSRLRIDDDGPRARFWFGSMLGVLLRGFRDRHLPLVPLEDVESVHREAMRSGQRYRGSS
jgi:hypothetical protein